MSRGRQNASNFMETGFEKKKEVANILGLQEWLYFVENSTYGYTEIHRIDIYSGKIETKVGHRWYDPTLQKASAIVEYADHIYEK